jgi:hypothetical protein
MCDQRNITTGGLLRKAASAPSRQRAPHHGSVGVILGAWTADPPTRVGARQLVRGGWSAHGVAPLAVLVECDLASGEAFVEDPPGCLGVCAVALATVGAHDEPHGSGAG